MKRRHAIVSRVAAVKTSLTPGIIIIISCHYDSEEDIYIIITSHRRRITIRYWAADDILSPAAIAICNSQWEFIIMHFHYYWCFCATPRKRRARVASCCRHFPYYFHRFHFPAAAAITTPRHHHAIIIIYWYHDDDAPSRRAIAIIAAPADWRRRHHVSIHYWLFSRFTQRFSRFIIIRRSRRSHARRNWYDAPPRAPILLIWYTRVAVFIIAEHIWRYWYICRYYFEMRVPVFIVDIIFAAAAASSSYWYYYWWLLICRAAPRLMVRCRCWAHAPRLFYWAPLYASPAATSATPPMNDDRYYRRAYAAGALLMMIRHAALRSDERYWYYYAIITYIRYDSSQRLRRRPPLFSIITPRQRQPTPLLCCAFSCNQ